MKKYILLLVTIVALISSCDKEDLTYEMDIPQSSDKILKAGSLLWDGAASNGIGVFVDIHMQDNDYNHSFSTPSPNGSYFSAESDPIEGLVWHAHKDDLDRRCEVSHATGVTPVTSSGNTYYIGFRIKFGNVVNESYHTVMQWKTGGEPNLQNYPILITVHQGYFRVQHYQDGGSSVMLFTQPVVADTWYSFVIKIKVGNTASTGNVQLWWGDDSTPETLQTGGTSYTCKTFDGEWVGPKWGYYGATNSNGDTYFSQMKIASTYVDAAPNSSNEGVRFFQNTTYGGTSSQLLSTGNYTKYQLNALGVPNDWASSATVPSGWKVTMYQNDNFDGTSWILTGDTPSFVTIGANDEMSSCKIENAGVIFYQNTSYGGTASQAVPIGNYTMSQLAALGVPNDWASSATVPSGLTVTIYQNDNFGGSSWVLSGDTPSFVSIGANDEMSSCTIE